MSDGLFLIIFTRDTLELYHSFHFNWVGKSQLKLDIIKWSVVDPQKRDKNLLKPQANINLIT